MAQAKKNPGREGAEGSATVFHGKAEDGTNVVGIGNIRVVVTQDEDSWFAQGLEIDYAAQGKTLKDVRKQFEEGLSATVHEHLRVFGTINKLLRVAPPDVWRELYGTAGSRRFRFSQISLHKDLQQALQFEGIDYYMQQEAA